LIRSPQSIEVLPPRFTIWRGGLYMGQGELLQQGGEEDSSDPANEIFERVNPLEPPVGPGQLYLSFAFALYVN